MRIYIDCFDLFCFLFDRSIDRAIWRVSSRKNLVRLAARTKSQVLLKPARYKLRKFTSSDRPAS